MFAKQNRPHFQAALQCFHPASLQTVQNSWNIFVGTKHATHTKKKQPQTFLRFLIVTTFFFFFQACNTLEMCNEDFMRGN